MPLLLSLLVAVGVPHLVACGVPNLVACGVPNLVACGDPCAAVCDRMAAYAEDCGLEVPAEQVRECRQRQRREGERGDARVCRQHGDATTLREEWTCDDLADYFAPEDTGA